MTSVTVKISARREDVDFLVLRYLTENPSATQRDLAQTLGVSLGLINTCINSLIEKGMVKISNFRSGDNRLRHAYELTATGSSEKIRLTPRFLDRKIREFENLKREIELLQTEFAPRHIEQGRDQNRPAV